MSVRKKRCEDCGTIYDVIRLGFFGKRLWLCRRCWINRVKQDDAA